VSSSGGIGNLSHVDQAGPEEVERQEESRPQETVPTATTSGEDHDEKALQGLESVYPEAHGKAEGNNGTEPAISRVPQEIFNEIVRNAGPEMHKDLRRTNYRFRNAANANVEKVTLNSPEGAKGGSAIQQAASAFRSAKDITLQAKRYISNEPEPKDFTDEHAKELASFQAAHSVTLRNTPRLTGDALTGLPRNLQRLALLHEVDLVQSRDNAYGPIVEDKDLANLPPDLKTFISLETRITDAGLKDLPRGITSLGLLTQGVSAGYYKGPEITDAGIKDLPPKLKRLLIESSAITDGGIKDLPKNIERLDLLSTEVTGAAIKDIPESVHTLGLALSSEDMNTGLASLSKNVHTLTVSGNGAGLESEVSDETIAALPKTVLTIHLVGNVSAERLQKLRNENPNRTITAEREKNYMDSMHASLRGGDQGFV
jgi:hypothetical protein